MIPLNYLPVRPSCTPQLIIRDQRPHNANEPRKSLLFHCWENRNENLSLNDIFRALFCGSHYSIYQLSPSTLCSTFVTTSVSRERHTFQSICVMMRGLLPHLRRSVRHSVASRTSTSAAKFCTKRSGEDITRQMHEHKGAVVFLRHMSSSSSTSSRSQRTKSNHEE